MEHSIVKTSIISKYFKSWAGIIKTRTRSGKMAYFDLFAGKGRYDDGTASTPILIMESIIADPSLRDKVLTFFADESPEFVAALKANIGALPGIETLNFKPRIATSKAKDSGLDQHFATASIVPTFLFLDPFGYEGVTVKLIHAILKDWGCDVAFFFCFRRMPAAIRNDKVRGHMDELFGRDRVDELRRLLPSLQTMADKEQAILAALEASLQSAGGRFVQTFRFRDGGGTVTHHIVFVSKDATAHKIMKDIMAAASSGEVDSVKDFEFTNAPRFPLSTKSPIVDLMDDLLRRFAGRTLSIDEVVAEHHYGTPYIAKNYQEALRRLTYDRGATHAHRGPLSPVLSAQRRDMPLKNTYVTFPAKA